MRFVPRWMKILMRLSIRFNRWLIAEKSSPPIWECCAKLYPLSNCEGCIALADFLIFFSSCLSILSRRLSTSTSVDRWLVIGGRRLDSVASLSIGEPNWEFESWESEERWLTLCAGGNTLN